MARLPLSPWTVRQIYGTVEELHALLPDPHTEREVWVLLPQNTSLVLGSTQPDEVTGPALAGPALAGSAEVGPAVVRRRSGGAAVLLSPNNSLWVDVVISPDDPLWHEDVSVAALWLGHVWAKTLGILGAVGVQVCDSYVAGRWGSLVCFASRGPGEVLVGGAKAVGISQRRTRTHARFQCLLYRQWLPEELIACLAVPSPQVAALQDDLAAAVWTVASDPREVLRTFLAALPT
ncbi:MAG: hypothetical protein OXE04_01310 [bacterium]|nr:hypothetical protein [bacterium]